MPATAIIFQSETHRDFDGVRQRGVNSFHKVFLYLRGNRLLTGPRNIVLFLNA